VVGTFHWLSSTTPDFWTAVFTGALLIVAVVTAWIGLSALTTANETALLEATPYLVLTEGGPIGKMPDEHQDYVLSCAVGGVGTPTLRSRSYEADEPQLGPGVTMSPHYGGRRDWPRRVIGMRNVGRSPAVDVAINITFELDEPDGLDYEKLTKHPRSGDANPAPWSAGRDYPLRKVGTNGTGVIEIPAIAPSETAFVLIENRFAATTSINIPNSATARGVDAQKRISIPILPPKRTIDIPFRA
jgi:hypothetical protein